MDKLCRDAIRHRRGSYNYTKHTHKHTPVLTPETCTESGLTHQIHNREFTFEGLAKARGVPRLLDLVTLLPGTVGCVAGAGSGRTSSAGHPSIPSALSEQTLGAAAREPEASYR